MSNIEWILIIITIFLVILLFRYIQLKKQIRNLADQVNELNSGNSQQMLDISLIDKDLERLAGMLNQYNIRHSRVLQRMLRIPYIFVRRQHRVFSSTLRTCREHPERRSRLVSDRLVSLSVTRSHRVTSHSVPVSLSRWS